MRRLIGALTLTVILSGCAASERDPDEPSAGSGGRLPADQVVLSIDHGAFVDPVEFHADVTDVVVYGDGRVYRAVQYGPRRTATYEMAKVDAAEVAQLVDEAEQSGLIDEATSYGHPDVMDGGSVLVSVHGQQGSSSVEVHALHRNVQVPSSADQAHREQLIALIDKIKKLADGAPAAPVDAAQVVQAAAWNPSGAAWPGPPPAEFMQPVTDDGQITACGVLTGEQAQAAVDAAAQNDQIFHWMVDGQAMVLVVRPLLPHEQGCTDL